MAWDRDELMRQAHEMVKRHPELRLGQALYNVAYSQNPAIAHLAGTEWSCFYRDDKIEAFLGKIDAQSRRPFETDAE